MKRIDMSKLLIAAVVVLLTAVVGLAQPKGPTVTVKGEVVDLWCYLERAPALHRRHLSPAGRELPVFPALACGRFSRARGDLRCAARAAIDGNHAERAVVHGPIMAIGISVAN